MPEYAPYELDGESPGSVRQRTVSGERRPTAKATAAKQVLAYPSITPPVLVPTALDSTYISDITEAAQDAVGAMAANSSKVTLTYVDGTPSLTADIVTGSLALSDLASVAWTAYTPTVTQGGTVTSFTANTSKWVRGPNRTITAMGRITINNAGTAAGGNDVTVSLPVTALDATLEYSNTGGIFDNSAALIYAGAVRKASTTTLKLLTIRAGGAPLSTAGNVFLGSIDFTAALATGDIIDFCITYEAAS